MTSLLGLITRVEHLEGPDRQLDAEIVAAVFGPPGCTVDPVAGLDGWDIQGDLAVDDEPTIWREAADIGHITHLIEDAFAFVGKARPGDGVQILSRALRAVRPTSGATTASYAQRLSCSIVAETLRALSRDAGDVGEPTIRAGAA